MTTSQTPKTKKPLIIIYGPPGVGKLTVAKELNKLTNIPLFHGHLSRDLVRSVFTNISGLDLTNKIRLQFFDFAAKMGCGLIFTFVYAKTVDDDFMHKLVEYAKNNNCPIYFIQLLCDENEWKDRVKREDRKEHDKVIKFDEVKQTMTKYEILTPYSVDPKIHKTINITNIEPEQTAAIIQSFILI